MFSVTIVNARNFMVGPKKVYGDNLVTLKPFFGYASPQVNDVGIGVAYERFLNNYISGKIPFNVGLSQNLLQSGIGLKFYPSGHKRTVKYAVGPTLLFGRSTATDFLGIQDSNGVYRTIEVENPLTQIGFMLTNSLNLTIQKNVYIGVEMGLGINYLNDFKYDSQQLYPNGYYNNFQNEEPNVLFQFNIELGYRF